MDFDINYIPDRLIELAAEAFEHLARERRKKGHGSSTACGRDAGYEASNSNAQSGRPAGK